MHTTGIMSTKQRKCVQTEMTFQPLILSASQHVLEFFSKLNEIGNSANIGIRDFTTWKKKISEKCYPQWE